MTVPAGTEVEEECLGDGTGQKAFNAAITAIRITSSSVGTEPTVLPHHIVPRPAEKLDPSAARRRADAVTSPYRAT